MGWRLGHEGTDGPYEEGSVRQDDKKKCLSQCQST